MKLKPSTISSILICNLLCTTVTSLNSNYKNHVRAQPVSRRRRHLIFPAEASLQMSNNINIIDLHISKFKVKSKWNFTFFLNAVYDQIIPIVDYTNLLILGVTCALAWELPDKPVHASEELMNQYQNGTLPLLLRMDENITETTNNHNYNYHKIYDSYYYHQSNKDGFNNWNADGAKTSFATKMWNPWQEKKWVKHEILL